MKNKILILNGRTAAGKTFLAKEMIERDDGFEEILSFTTRAPRAGEVDGKDYRFVTTEFVHAAKEKNDIFETAEVLGNHYGILKQDLNAVLERNKTPIFVCDYRGAITALKLCPDMGITPVTAFIEGDDITLVSRMLDRYKNALSEKECLSLSSRLSSMYTEEKQWKDSIDYNIFINKSTDSNLADIVNLINDKLNQDLPLSSEQVLSSNSCKHTKNRLETLYFQFLSEHKSLDKPSKVAQLINKSTQSFLVKWGIVEGDVNELPLSI